MRPDPLSTLSEDEFDARRLHQHETLFAIGNGYLGTRGAFEEGYPGERRGTFISGVFDEAPLVGAELVNVPDWLPLEVRIAGEPFSLDRGTVRRYLRWLDLRTGLLTREVIWRSPAGQSIELRYERFASLADPHLVLLRVGISALERGTSVELRARLDGHVHNLGLVHWQWMDQAVSGKQAWMECCTRTSKVRLAAAMRVAAEPRDLEWSAWDARNQPTLRGRAELAPGDTLQVEKLVAYFTSRETDDPACAARDAVGGLPDPAWEALWPAHQRAWEDAWRACDVVIEGDDESQFAVRFNLYHLLIAAPRQDERVTIGAKTLTGFGYRGHAFWDTEAFMLPFFTHTQPEIARNLLSYRWHTLPGARRKALANRYQGAQFPWESADNGDEVTPTWIPDPHDRQHLIRIWTGDLQIHISADIAHAIWRYWKATGDDEFLRTRGAEVILDTARFWASRAEWDESRHRYGFMDVIGPDEYHEHVDQNAYTNYLARWHLRTARQVWDWLQTHSPQVAEQVHMQLDLGAQGFTDWQRIAEQMHCPFDPSSHWIEQFEGFERLRYLDLKAIEPRERSMQLILGIEGANHAQVIKQPDVLMLLHVLREEFDLRTLEANYDYYTPRTDLTHGSSLGPAIHAILASELGRTDEAYGYFQRAAHVDLRDLRGNTADGIHGASAGAVWQAVVFGFAGLRVQPDGWTAHPRLPRSWRRVAFRFLHHGRPEEVELLAKGERSRTG